MKMKFHGIQKIFTYTQTNNAIPEKVFPLLCPIREIEWLPDWNAQVIYSKSGVSEENAVFTTRKEDGNLIPWIVTKYLPNDEIEFIYVDPDIKTAKINIKLSLGSDLQSTMVSIEYTHTGLSQQGNMEIENISKEKFNENMKFWEKSINYYLHNRSKISEQQINCILVSNNEIGLSHSLGITL